MSTTTEATDVSLPRSVFKIAGETLSTVADLALGAAVLFYVDGLLRSLLETLGLGLPVFALDIRILVFFLGTGSIIWASLVTYARRYWSDNDSNELPWEDKTGLDYYMTMGFTLLVLAVYKTLVIGLGAVAATIAVGTSVQAIAIATLVVIPLVELYSTANGHSRLWPVAVTVCLTTLPAVFIAALVAYTLQRTGDATRHAVNLLSEVVADLTSPPATGGLVDLFFKRRLR